MDPMEEEKDHGESEDECCPICYENFFKQGLDEEAQACFRNTKECLRINGCQHKFCRNCLTKHCEYAVSIRDLPIKCPANVSDKCENTMGEEQIQDLFCSPEAVEYGSISTHWTRYQRFQQLLQDPSLICCSRCVEIVSKDENITQGGYEDELTCPTCGHTFCALHGDSHQGLSCQEYKSHKPGRQMRKSEKMIQRLTKPCSHCGVPIEKASGCDHVICVSCNEDMCYKCGTHTHLRGEGMIRICENCEQSYVDHRYIWSYRLAVCMSLPFYIPLCIIYICVMGAVAILSFGCCCCLGCGADADPEGETTFSFIRGVERVLVIVFLPALDLFRECGLDCGFREYEKYTRRPQSPETTHIEDENDSISDVDDVDSAV
jgi:hypothetical protein